MRTSYKLLSRVINYQTIRSFSATGNPFRGVAAKEFGQELKEEFLPDNEEMELDKLAEDDAKISIRGGIKKDQLRHEEEFSGTIYKYDLPVGNVPI